MGRSSRNKRERKAATPLIRNVSTADVDGLLGKLEQADPTTLSPADLQLTHDIVETWSYLMTRLRAGRLTMREMKKLAGIMEEARKRACGGGAGGSGSGTAGGDGSAPTDGKTANARGSDVGDSSASDDADSERRRDEHGRRDAGTIGVCDTAHHEHDLLRTGDPCPVEGCTGRLYFRRPQVFTTITAEPPFSAREHTIDVLECNKCKAIFPAPLPKGLKDDLPNGNGSHLYATSATVMITLLRYFSGFPWYRQEGFFAAMGGPRIPDSSMADQSEKVANAFFPIYRLLLEMAARAWLLMSDDTGGRILSLPTKVKEQRSTGDPTERNGCHTTAMIALVPDEVERRIVLFKTGIHYSGEIVDDVFERRPAGLPKPFVLGDGSQQNDVTVIDVVRCGCNAHAVRKFKDAVSAWPDEAGHALEVYDEIYRLEAEIKAAGLSPEARLERHRAVSKPLLNELCRYGQRLFDERKIEPNSADIGTAFNYLLNQQRALMAFTHYVSIPLDNNEDERTIKLIVLVRKNSQHFATVAGAGHADVLWSCGVTALRAGENLWDYSNAIVRYRAEVRANPEAYLPWNWRKTVARLHDAPGVEVAKREPDSTHV